MYNNTTITQDKQIEAAQSSGHINNLVAIIEQLDSELTEAKGTISERDDEIGDFKSEISGLTKQISQLGQNQS
jgi:peptidoglycan hydrolase CwlO-like protein